MFFSLCAFLLILQHVSVTALNFQLLRQLTGLNTDIKARYIDFTSRLWIPESVDDALNFLFGDTTELAPNFTGKQPMFIDNRFVIRYFFTLTVFDDSIKFTNESLVVWDKIFQAVESHTCLKFLPMNESYSKRTTKPSLKINLLEDNCGVLTTGRHEEGYNILGFGECGNRVYTGIHELMHVLGFEHEHNRSDRDDFIYVHWENMDPTFYFQYEKKEYPQLGMDLTDERYYYDYYSVMHYPSVREGADKSKPFFTGKCGNISIPRNKKLSPLDIHKLNFYYSCDRYKFLIPAYKHEPSYWFNTDDNSFGFRGTGDDFPTPSP